MIRRAQQRHNALWQEVVSKRVSSVQYAALPTLQHSPGLSQNELGAALDLDRSTIADLVSRMVTRGVISREQDAADRRRNVLHLTPTGATEVDALRPGVERVNQILTSSLDTEQTEGLRTLLQAVLTPADEG